MSTTKESSESHIELLTEENFPSWIVDIRTKLRSKKLWTYTQSLYKDENIEETTTAEGESSTPTPAPKIAAALKKEQKAIQKWEKKTQETADLMTPTITRTVKKKLTETEFNNGYLMLSRLHVLLQPSGFSEFMRLSKEYYTLQFKGFKSISEYLTHIKVLEEKIDATKITLDADNRTILCFSMSLPQEYQYLIQIWAVTPSITAEKARTMLLEASRQHKLALHNTSDHNVAAHRSSRAIDQANCEHCGSTKHPNARYWAKFPHLAPEWYKLKLKYDKEKKNGKHIASLASREDDFVDRNGTHISA